MADLKKLAEDISKLSLVDAVELKNLLKDEYGSKILSIDDLYGFSKFIESQAFGYLGIRSFKKLPISFPSTTGVRVPVTGGVLTNLSKL